MIPNKEWRQYIAVKQLLRGITSKHHHDFYCLNCLYSFRTENKLKSHNKVIKNNDFFNIVVPSNDTKILEFSQYQKSDKAPFIVAADLECSLEKIYGCKNKPKNSFTTKVGERILLFKRIEKKAWCIQRQRLCEKALWILKRKHSGDN